MTNKHEEHNEQSRVVTWCKENGLRVGSIPNSINTPYWGEVAKQKVAGLCKGMPDLIVGIPPKKRLDGKGKLLFIEMKKVTGGKTSPEQRDWLTFLNDCDGVTAYVCAGAEVAKATISKWIEIWPDPEEAMKEFLLKNNL